MMTEPLLRTEPPSDAQLDLMKRLCEERGLPMPAPASKLEAELLITDILNRTYRPLEWDYHDETAADRETEALAQHSLDVHEPDIPF
jgi:hypothetical protein